MMRLVILVAVTVILVVLLARLFPRFRAQLRRVLASTFVRRILFGVVLRPWESVGVRAPGGRA